MSGQGQITCSGDGLCAAAFHVHGCYADADGSRCDVCRRCWHGAAVPHERGCADDAGDPNSPFGEPPALCIYVGCLATAAPGVDICRAHQNELSARVAVRGAFDAVMDRAAERDARP